MTFTELTTLLSRFIHRINDVDICQMAGIAEGTNTATLKVANEIVYNLYNQQITLEIQDNIAMTSLTAQAADSSCWYLISVNLSEAITITAGSDSALPSVPSGQIAIGAFHITTDDSHTFTCGTTDLSGAGITALLYDIDCGIAPTLINFAMRDMERKYNFRGMKRRTTYTLHEDTDSFDNPIPLYKDLVSVYGLDDDDLRYPISKQDFESVSGAFAATQTGPPQLIAEVPEESDDMTPDEIPNLQFIIRPYTDDNYTIVFTAHRYSPFMDAAVYQSNWWTVNHPDVLLYGALVGAEPYLINDSRLELWKTLYDEKLSALILAESEEPYSGKDQYTKADE